MGKSISPDYRDPHADTHSMQKINSFVCWVIFHTFVVSFKNYFRNAIRVLNEVRSGSVAQW